MMNIVHNTTDYHKGVLAAGVLFGIAYIYSFPLSVAVAACVISDDEVEQMALSSDDSFLNGIGKKHEWQGDSMPYNYVPTHSNVLEPGGHVPTGNNVVGSLLSPKLTEAARTEHIATLQENSHCQIRLTMPNVPGARCLCLRALWHQFLLLKMQKFSSRLQLKST